MSSARPVSTGQQALIKINVLDGLGNVNFDVRVVGGSDRGTPHLCMERRTPRAAACLPGWGPRAAAWLGRQEHMPIWHH